MTEKKKQVWGSHLNETPLDEFVIYCAGRDIAPIPAADYLLIPYDILTNLAHLKGLKRINVLDDHEAQALTKGLLTIHDLYERGEFHLDPLKEDVHINIESYLTEVLGIAAGEKLHTARSRNDQILTDMRLFVRENTTAYVFSLIELTETLITFSQQHNKSYMPGYTHYQPAMPTTLGHWILSWVYGILRDMGSILYTLRSFNLCPLGSAASFGSAWNPDREYVSSILGFDAPQENTLDTITNRGEFETALSGNISLGANRFSVMAQDLIVLSHPNFNFIQLPDRFTSGSSIMPHKKNPDFAELIRARASVITGISTGLLGLQKGVISGYNRDSQYSKHLIMDLLRECQGTPKILNHVMKGCSVNMPNMLKQASVDFINSADMADFIAVKCGLGFREAYNITAKAVKYSEGNAFTNEGIKKALAEAGIQFDGKEELPALIKHPHKVIDGKTHTGAPAPETVRQSAQKAANVLADYKKELKEFHSHYSTALNQLLQ